MIVCWPLSLGQWEPLPEHAPRDERLEPPLEPAHPGRCAESTVYSHAQPGGCHLSVLTNSALVMRVQMRGGGGLAGSQPMSTAVHITWHGGQITSIFNFMRPTNHSSLTDTHTNQRDLTNHISSRLQAGSNKIFSTPYIAVFQIRIRIRIHMFWVSRIHIRIH